MIMLALALVLLVARSGVEPLVVLQQEEQLLPTALH
jgi:hypothetical protein